MKDLKQSSGSASVNTCIEKLMKEGQVKTSTSLFKRVLNTLREAYSELLNTNSVNVDYGNCQITLN